MLSQRAGKIIKSELIKSELIKSGLIKSELIKPELTILLNKTNRYLQFGLSNSSICSICNGSGKIYNKSEKTLRLNTGTICKTCKGRGILT
tara:strand:+ start:937 stop:1209 length:273 start_codon:yes stop_codon:yes gene_type:complete